MVMSIQEDILAILTKYGIKRVWGYINPEGELKVGFRRAGLNYEYDDIKREKARLYYLKNRERIRKKQHEYHLRRKAEMKKRESIKFSTDNITMAEAEAEISKPRTEAVREGSLIQMEETNENPGALQEREKIGFSDKHDENSFFSFFESRYQLIDHMQLASAMVYAYRQQGLRVNESDVMETALQAMQYFGYEREILANNLEHEDLVILYQLEDLGLVTSRIEEITIYDRKSWRINKFILNKEKILEFSVRQAEAERSVENLYESLPEEVWVR